MNKKISFPIAIIIIIVCAVLVGGIVIWQYFGMPKGEEEISKGEVLEELPEDETADWKVYRNKEYGFEVKYPSGVEIDVHDYVDQEPDYLLLTTTFEFITIIDGYNYLCANYNIRVEKTEYQDINSWVEDIRQKIETPSNYEGDMISGKLSSVEDMKIQGKIAKKVTIEGGFPFMAAYFGVINNGKLYAISYLDMSYYGRSGCFEGDVEQGEAKYRNIFDQILSTFRFIEDETADWQTYRNEKYGFEFKYPHEWIIEDLSGTKDILVYINLRPSGNIDCGCGLHRFFIDVDKKSIEEHRTTLGYTTIEAEEEIEISGVSGIKQIRKHDGELIFIFFPIDSDKTLEINFGDDCDEDNKDLCDEAMNQMLSTFRFIEDETADWQTYRNEKYNYKIKYPDSWNSSVELGDTDALTENSSSFIKKGNVLLGLSIIVYENTENLSLKEWWEEQYKDWSVKYDYSYEGKKFIAPEIEAEAYKIERTGFYDNCYLISKNQKVYMIYFSVLPGSEEIDQMLSTFRFLE